jgi:CIC family chloride channel protein
VWGTFLRGLAVSRQLFGRLSLPLPWRLALGGLVVGLVSAGVPQVWGNGYSVVNSVLHSPMTITALAIVLAAKIVATLATAGSGAVGGVFTPALFFGCMIGALYGHAAQLLWPGATSAPFAYAVVGMGAFLAGAAQAPLMAILMIFEMTLSYQVMLPLMASSVVAYFVARSANAGSMYEITGRRREQDSERLRLRSQYVRDLVKPAETVVGLDANLQEMSRLFLQYPVKYLYVVDAQSHYLGVVPLAALSTAAQAGEAADKQARNFLAKDIEPIVADMTLGQALQRFMDHRGERLPVIESLAQPTLLGAVGKSALLATYVQLSE